MAEARTIGYSDNNDGIWEFLDKISRPIGGGSGAGGADDIWEDLGVVEGDQTGLVERFQGAVDGVGRWLAGLKSIKIGLPKREAAPVAPKERNIFTRMLSGGRKDGGTAAPTASVEAQPGEKSGFFNWLGELRQRVNDWDKRGEVPAPAAPEGEADRFGWLKNTWKWLRGVPGGIAGRFGWQPEAGAAPQMSRAERVKALKEGTTQFLKEWGPEIAVGLLGGYLGYSTVSMDAAVATGNFTPIVMEIGASLTAGLGFIGFALGGEQAAESLSDVEGRFGRVAKAIQAGCANRVVRRGFKLLAAGSSGFAVGGIGRMVVETLQTFQQVAPAGAPATPEAGGSVSSSVGTVVSPDVAELHAEAVQHAIEAVQSTVNQSTADIVQANQTLSGISPDLLGDSSVSPLADSARHALETANQFYSNAMASGGIDASEAAKLKELASQAQQAVDAAKQIAQHVTDSLAQAAQAAQAAADTAAAQAAATANAETVRQGVLQSGQIMKDVISATPSQTAFEALQQQVFQATGSPYAVEAANALSWTLPKADITGLHTGAISEAAKTVADLIGRAHDYTAGRGVEYTINSIRQAVDAGQLSADVLKAVEAANAPVGEVKAAAQTGLNTILQGIIK